MEAPIWLKPAISGGLVGAVATMIVGFSYGGWMLGGSAEKMAEQRSTAAVTEALVDVVLRRPALDFREEVTLDQRRRYFGYWGLEIPEDNR